MNFQAQPLIIGDVDDDDDDATTKTLCTKIAWAWHTEIYDLSCHNWINLQ